MLPVLLGSAFPGLLRGERDIDLATYVEQTDPADVLYNQGLANMNAGRLNEASKKFEAIDRQHPYSEYGRKALVMGAFADYRQGKYEEAINAGKRYVQLYPTDPDAAYAQYIVGLSYFRQIRDVTQDQKESRRAIEAMEEVVQRWPDSEYVEDAKTKIRFARDQLAGKEMQVGRYYLERREYIAAIKRFRYVVENYSNTRQVEEALARLTEAYYAMGLDLRGADGRGGARPQLPRQPVVQGFLPAAADRRPPAARGWRLVDVQGGQDDRRRRLTAPTPPACSSSCRSAISS